MGSGVRVPLKFIPNLKVRGGPKGQANVSLFPGAIVALKGKNGGGGWFSVFEVMAVRLSHHLTLYYASRLSSYLPFFPLPRPLYGVTR
jgi:hypothetical protein